MKLQLSVKESLLSTSFDGSAQWEVGFMTVVRRAVQQQDLLQVILVEMFDFKHERKGMSGGDYTFTQQNQSLLSEAYITLSYTVLEDCDEVGCDINLEEMTKGVHNHMQQRNLTSPFSQQDMHNILIVMCALHSKRSSTVKLHFSATSSKGSHFSFSDFVCRVIQIAWSGEPVSILTEYDSYIA